MRKGSPPALQPDDAGGSARRRAGAVLLVVAGLLGGCAGLTEDAPPEPAETAESAALAPRTLDLAEQAIAEDRLNDAERLLERVFLTDSSNVRARLIMGELLLAQGEPARAAAFFVGLTSDPVVGPRANQGAGISKLLTGEADSGAAHLQGAVEADPTLWRAWNALGSHYDSKGQWAAAGMAYGRALAQRSDEAMIYNNRGFSYFMQGRLDDSIADLRQALRLDPELTPAEVNLRVALAWSGRYVHALSGADDDDMATVLNNIGYVALMRGDLDNAEAYLLRAMEVDPTFNEVAWRNLAYLRNLRELRTSEPERARAVEPAEAVGE